MLIDTHCHLDAPAFDNDRAVVIQKARDAGIGAMIVPSVAPTNFAVVQALAHSESGIGYALGIHPLFVAKQTEQALDALRDALTQARDDPKLVAVGEIGLDYFVQDAAPAKQEHFYHEQLKLAAQFDLPVILHVRKSADRLLKYLLNFALGFGGSLTYERARQIRRHVTDLAATAHVLETDAPDIAPQWIARQRNEPSELVQIAAQFAQLRATDLPSVLAQTASNAVRVLPKIRHRTDQHLVSVNALATRSDRCSTQLALCRQLSDSVRGTSDGTVCPSIDCIAVALVVGSVKPVFCIDCRCLAQPILVLLFIGRSNGTGYR